jgi:FAD/FMN-containing dehydrogenase
MNQVECDTRRNWSRNVTFNPHVCYKPRSEKEVLDILKKHESGSIRVVGSRHSMNEIAKSDDVWIDMTEYKAQWTWNLNGTPPTVTVPAGVTLETLQDALASRGKTLPARGTIKKQTIAGAISTGTHGSGRPSLSNFITRVRVAAYGSSGNARVVDIDQGDHLLAARTALGAMGVILEITLRVSDGYFVEQSLVIVESIDDVLIQKGNELEYPLQLFVRFPYGWKYAVSRRRQSVRGPQGIWEHIWRDVRRFMNEKGNDRTLPWLISNLVAPYPKMTPTFYKAVLPRLLLQQDPVIDDDDHVQTMRHELFPNQDIELFVPESLFRAADDWLKHIISAFADSDYVVPQNIVDSVRQAGLTAAFTRGSYTHHAPIFYQRVLRDDTLISMTAGASDACYSIIVLSYLPPEPEGGRFEKFAQFVGEGLVRLFNARAHWGKYFPLGVGDLEGRYDPNLPKFRKICDEYDPNGVFRNEFTARALGLAKPSNIPASP